MAEASFFPRAEPLSVADIAALARIDLPHGACGTATISGAAPLETAGPDDLVYMENAKYAEVLGSTRAGACLVSKRFAGRVPVGTVALVTPQPYEVFAQALARLYPSAMRPLSSFGAAGVSPGSSVHPTARLEHNVTVDPGAVIGPEAEIGPQVRIGRDCSIGPTATLLNAFLGNRVILHPGVRVGQDGFGFAMGPRGHKKVPQIGRVIIQDDVEIGSNTTVDRGASRDTVI